MMFTKEIQATLDTVKAKSTCRGVYAVTLEHVATDPETFWQEAEEAEALVLDAAGLHPGEFRLGAGTLARDAAGLVTEECSVYRRDGR